VRGDLALLCRLTRFFAPPTGLRLTTESGVPAGSGLGGSSTLAIAACGALNEFTGAGCTREDLINIARDIEAQVLEIPTGEQDYYAAIHGGLSAWHFRVREVSRETPAVPIADLESRLLLFYSGLPRSSGINNWQVYKQFIDGDRATRESLAEINRQSGLLLAALRAGDWTAAAAAIAAEWSARKRLAPAITTPEVEEILAFGARHGARAGKVCGAGGGGCLFLLADPDTRPAIEQAARESGLRVLDFHVAAEGLSVRRS
jgi:D-glycero-alpha-D-manno-heptose-7-phosphate kinase